MMDGFAVFLGVAGTVIVGMVLMLVYAGAVDHTKQEAAQNGYFESRGAYFSVKPAKTLRAE